MTISQQYIRNLTGPIVQENGEELENRRPIVNYTNGLAVEDDPTDNRLNISVDVSSVFTSSNGGVTFYTQGSPAAGLTGLISSGSSVSVTCSITPNSSQEFACRATIRNHLSATIYTKSIFTHSTYVSGSTAVLDFSNIADDNFSTVPVTLAGNLIVNNMVFTLTSGTGSNYSYTLIVNKSEYTF